MLVNLINLGFCDEFKILGLVLNSNWGFCSKLACYIDEIDHPYLFSLICDDQFVNLLQIVQVVFQIFGVFVRNYILKPIL